MTRFVDKTGQKYGRLTAIRRAGTNERGRTLWECQCECGNTVVIDISHLNASGRKSCGCLRIENLRKAVCLPEGQAAFNALFGDYKRDAQKRKLAFDLTKEQFKTIVTSNCFYCGAEPGKEYVRKWSNGSFAYNGVDRKDNNVGYILDNCVPCCWSCNFLKRGLDYTDFLSRVKAIADYKLR